MGLGLCATLVPGLAPVVTPGAFYRNTQTSGSASVIVYWQVGSLTNKSMHFWFIRPLYLIINIMANLIIDCLNIQVNPAAQDQAMHPVRWGGLGARSTVVLAPSAFLSSITATGDLASCLLLLEFK
jgi:hypothetical protein